MQLARGLIILCQFGDSLKIYFLKVRGVKVSIIPVVLKKILGMIDTNPLVFIALIILQLLHGHLTHFLWA